MNDYVTDIGHKEIGKLDYIEDENAETRASDLEEKCAV